MLSKKGLRPLAARFDPPPLVRASSAPSGGQREAACAVGLAAGAGGGLSGPDGRSCPQRPSVRSGRGPEFEGLQVWGKNSYIKGASFFCACWGRMEVPAAPHLR